MRVDKGSGMGVWIVVSVLVAATLFGVWRRRSDGRMHDVSRADLPPVPTPTTATDVTGPGHSEVVSEPRVTHDPPEADASDVTSGLAASPPGHAGASADVSATPVPDGLHLTADDLGAALGSRATLVQFSSAFCQPCRATRIVLRDIDESLDGVNHVEIDAESHLDLVHRFHVMRTPTVMVLDPSGKVRKRASGLARKPEVLLALGEVFGELETEKEAG